MSRKKRITINSAEYQRLLESETQLRAIRHDLPEVLEVVRRESVGELQRRLEPLEQRQRAFQQAVSQLNTDVRDMEQQTAQRLERQQREMRKALQNMAGRLREETRTLLAEQERRLTNLVEQEHKTRELQVRNLQEQITAIVADQQRKGELARSWINAAEVLRDFIEGNYRHEQFAPGQLKQLEREVRQARENVASGVPEAALSLAQQACHGLSDLRLELERLEREWQLCRLAALESARELLAIARSNRQCQALDTEGKDTGIAIEVDWWTEGKLSALENEVNALITQVQDERKPLTTDELRNIVEQTAPDLRQRLEQVIKEARLAVVSSQLRINIADLVVQALEEKGFSVQDGTYEGEDMRNGYAAKVRNLGGDEVVICVTPVEGESGRNELQIHSYDEAPLTEHELRQRAQEVSQALQARGLEVGKAQTIGARPDPSMRDIEVVRQREPLRRRVTAS